MRAYAPGVLKCRARLGSQRRGGSVPHRRSQGTATAAATGYVRPELRWLRGQANVKIFLGSTMTSGGTMLDTSNASSDGKTVGKG